MRVDTVTIPGRFNGPEGMVNGGIASGLVSSHIEGPTKVRLHAPVPLDRALELRTGEDQATLTADGRTFATAVKTAPSSLNPPRRIRAGEVESLPRFNRDLNPFPTCFVCGHLRTDGMGLEMRHTPEGGIAAVFDPTRVMARGLILAPRFLWAALDCPSGYAALQDIGPGVLGTLTAEIHRRVVVGEPLVVIAERREVEGRKIASASALYDHEGDLVAYAETVWVTIGEREGAA